MVEVIVRCVHYEGEEVQLSGQLFLGPDDVSGGVEPLVGGRAVNGGQKPGNDTTFLAILVGQKASKLSVVNTAINVNDRHNVPSRVVKALKINLNLHVPQIVVQW